MGAKIPHFTKEDYEIVDRQVPYAGIFRLAKYYIRHRLFNGGWTDTFTREILERPSAVAVLPYDPVLDRVILIQQFRAGALTDPKNPWLIEIVAGCTSPGEMLEEVVKREALEEAGCTLQALYTLYDYFVSPGGSNEEIRIYIGKIDASDVGGVHGLPEEHEDINVLNIPLQEAIDMLHHGKIKTSPAILSLLWLEYNRKQLPQLWREVK